MQDCPNPGRCTRIPCICEEREGKPPREMPHVAGMRAALLSIDVAVMEGAKPEEIQAICRKALGS